MTYEEKYLSACENILTEGKKVYNERTGHQCYTLPYLSFEYDVSKDPPPLFSTRQSFPVSAWAEILGYLRGYQWADQFDKIGAKTWYANANETISWLNNPNRLGKNHMGLVYGAALEPWELPQLFDKLNRKVDDRGLKINFWRPEKFEKGCLRPCLYEHTFTILDDTLHLVSNQRSCDMACGKNFNALQVTLLLKMFAQITGLKAGIARHNIVNPHIYDIHVDGIKEMMKRQITPIDAKLEVRDWVTNFRDLLQDDLHSREYIKLTGYEHLDNIKFKLIA